MGIYVAFLRAVNVGGRVVKMEALRGLFERAKFTGVETYIQSGNVVFQSRAKKPEALETQIEEFLHKSLGYEVTTFLRTIPELQAITEHRPFKKIMNDGDPTYVAFLRNTPSAELQRKLFSVAPKSDEFHFHLRELYWLRRPQEGVPFSGAFLEKSLKMPATIRNINTVAKIAAKYASG